MSTTIQIITEECVYISTSTRVEFEFLVKYARRMLKDNSNDYLATGHVTGISRVWEKRDDVVRPFGDIRQGRMNVCSLDLTQDLLLFSDASENIKLPLSRLREPKSELPQRSEFTPYKIDPPPLLDFAIFPPPYKSPSGAVDVLRLALIPPILSDFAFQWRHILRSSYRKPTLRRLAEAVVKIATLDFRIEEVSKSNNIFFGSPYVDVTDQPLWKLGEDEMFSVGNTTVIVHEDLETAFKIAKEEAASANGLIQQQNYLLFSVRYLMVAHVDSTGAFSHTAPTVFMDGHTLPSPSAITLLLQVLLPPWPPHTPIHSLPLEIVDQILLFVSEGPVEAARLGCSLDLGRPFEWKKELRHKQQGVSIELLQSNSHRSDDTPIESKICFGDEFCGVSYL
ncbi:hypothetical protein GLAREA_03191 [Glarea lozoyensis ATCC 20868]|uniref:Uncharacterized protein n=1 Tax=Glarea lozoyensis (strain ATCC 20868 / MF5171) TaxID=1116229 RepID=S3D5E5_GLAL2|nr:uncharacterized protein GLAREA_03191 [Glarea lozoyensis ATCC 20868]EPE27276.1 hypothetical protein GLAREA_03191 [Glarea lozoyensis ATCC 20868]